MFWHKFTFRRDRKRALELERALASRSGEGADDEVARLATLARRVGRLSTSAPTIDERRVWLRVRAGMLAQPQQAPRGLPRPLALFALAPRPLLAGGLAVVLLAVASVGSLVLQPRDSASAAFLSEVQQMVQASSDAANRGTLTVDESASLEQRALGLLDRASRPEVLGGLQFTEADLARARLMEARSALAAVVGENPGDTRALAALAAISGLLDPPQPAEAARGSTPAQVEATPTSTVAAAIEASSTPTATPVATPVQTPESKGNGPTGAPGRAPESTRTPEPEDRGRNATPTPQPSPAGALVSAAQAACARVYDAGSLGACVAAASTASAACAQTRGANGCQVAIEASIASAQQRVQRVGEDCQRLPGSKAREACSEATNKSRNSNNSRRSGGGQTNGSDSRGRRD